MLRRQRMQLVFIKSLLDRLLAPWLLHFFLDRFDSLQLHNVLKIRKYVHFIKIASKFIFGFLCHFCFFFQPLVVVMTTAPLALFNKIIWSIAKSNGLEGQGILAFYAAVGLWNTFFVCIYAFFNMSKLMKFSSRSTEEIFSNFITIAFIKDSTTVIVETFQDHYWKEECIHPAYNHNNTVSLDLQKSVQLFMYYLFSEIICTVCLKG